MLVALILVAGVANLNLSVANVALPDIGKHFDSSQTMLDLIAVGYSLGLAASVLYLGAVGDRYGRKLLLLLGMALSVPACLLAAFAPTDERAVRRARARRPLGGHGVPDDAGADHGAVVGARAHEVDRAVVGARRRDRLARAAASPGALLEQFDWGSVFLITLPLVVDRAADGLELRAGPRQRDDRPGRQPRRHPLGRAGRGADPGDQLRAGPRTRATLALGLGASRRPRCWPSTCASAARATRSTTSSRGAADVLGRGRAPGSSSSAR